MDELQALMGDSYQEGMTVEQIGEFFKGKKFADLSTGKYVDKDKFDTQVNNLTAQLNQTKEELDNKLSDDEKNAKAYDDLVSQNKLLQEKLLNNTISGNKNVINSIMMNSREILGIKSTDDDFNNFVDNIVSDNSDKSRETAEYISKIVKNSYEKGKKDALKNSMGEFGKSKSAEGTDDEVGVIGKRLAENQHSNSENKFDYFK